jgi:hypothetical protein
MSRNLLAILTLLAGFAMASSSGPARISTQTTVGEPDVRLARHCNRAPTAADVARFEAAVGFSKNRVLVRFGQPGWVYQVGSKSTWVYDFGDRAFYLTFEDGRSVDVIEDDTPCQTGVTHPVREPF